MGSSTTLPALATAPKIIFFTDYDGTITQQDSNDFLTDTVGFGPELRRKGNGDVLDGARDFRDSFQEMMDSVSLPFDACIDLLSKNITLDPRFRDFFHFCRENNVPIVILSGGMRPIIKGMLRAWLGDEETESIQIVSNDVAVRDGKRSINEEGGWRIDFHDESVFGHDKSREIRPYSALPEGERPILLYAGDGVSDLSAAKETDLLFAKKGRGEFFPRDTACGEWEDG
jgi:2,3-diketo-5-methylthio-1-phosphopentane phosphatase